MNNSLLASLPSLHGTMLSIIVGFVTAYALYAYQTTNSSRQKLEEFRRQVQQISTPSFEVVSGQSKCIDKSGKIDWQLFKDSLREASSLFGHLNSPEYSRGRKVVIYDDLKEKGDRYNSNSDIDTIYIKKTEIEKSAKETLSLLTLTLTSYPYLGQGVISKSASEEIASYQIWFDDLSRFNGFLIWLWNSNNKSLVELMKQYRDLEIQKQQQMHDEILQELISDSKKQGRDISDEEIQRIRSQFHIIRDIDYVLVMRDFFLKINQIDQQIIPKARDCLSILKMHENQFKLKTRTIWVLVAAVFIFVLGIITPIVITAYAKEPIARSLEISLLIGTTAPYLFGLLYLISIVSQLKQP